MITDHITSLCGYSINNGRTILGYQFCLMLECKENRAVVDGSPPVFILPNVFFVTKNVATNSFFPLWWSFGCAKIPFETYFAPDGVLNKVDPLRRDISHKKNRYPTSLFSSSTSGLIHVFICVHCKQSCYYFDLFRFNKQIPFCFHYFDIKMIPRKKMIEPVTV